MALSAELCKLDSSFPHCHPTFAEDWLSPLSLKLSSSLLPVFWGHRLLLGRQIFTKLGVGKQQIIQDLNTIGNNAELTENSGLPGN
jgi:hypothetical protein